MRAIAVLLPFCLVLPAQAQVSVDMRALERLGPSQPPAPPVLTPPPRPALAAPARPVPKPPASTGNTGPGQPGTGKLGSGPPATPPTAATRPPAATLPTGAPPAVTPAVLAPTPSPARPAKPPPLAALPRERPAEPPASTLVPAPVPPPEPPPPSVRLLFPGGVTDLSAEDQAAIRSLAKAIPLPETSSINVMAYAGGPENDPSTARRLSLSRGMAVRTALIASGFPSSQIYVRALGTPPAETAHTGAPPDRVELVVGRLGASTR